ncbi:energy transducer TonB [Paraburkholderia franconis]|uniref:energy transducer TonB n=1 Tax=Paraburkholderia franconis TaxID=2654983 RepID=UPI002AAFC6F6|nr:TonB family protein [Paraburkholderia franconis]
MRTGVAFVVALCIWVLVLFALSSGLLRSIRPARTAPSLDMRVIVLDPPAAPVSKATEAPAVPPPSTATEKTVPRAHAQLRTPVHRAMPAAGIRPDATMARADPAPVAAPAQRQTDEERSGEAAAARSQQPSVAHGGAPDAAPATNAAARSISQPLPALPDDLREQAYQTVATARFTIHVDGSVDVELVKATPWPRLNQLLLKTLHRWRFFPALRDGLPVESTQEIRVHFNVS